MVLIGINKQTTERERKISFILEFQLLYVEGLIYVMEIENSLLSKIHNHKFFQAGMANEC